MARLMKLAAAIAILALPLAACATQGPGGERRPEQRSQSQKRPAPALSAQRYVQTAASIDLFEIRSAELALTRARDPRLRDFARMMIDEHRGTSAQLSFAGRRLNLLPSATLMPVHQDLFNRLVAASAFDDTYRRQQLLVHEIALEVHRNYAARGDSPTLRPVAKAAAPIVERHLRMLRSF